MRVPSPQTTSTTPPSGLYLTALSSRLLTARSMRAADPEIQVGDVEVAKVTSRLRPWVVAASTAAMTSSSKRSSPLVTWGMSPRASSAMSATSDVSSSSWVRTSPMRTSRSSGASRSIWRATSMLVRRLVSGRPQLVGGVEHELALALAGGVEGGEQAVEGPAQAAELVGTAGVEPLGHVGGAGQLLDRVGEFVERSQHGPPHAQAEQDGEAHADQDDQPQGDGQVVEPVVDAGQRGRQLEGPAVGHGQLGDGLRAVAVVVGTAKG